MAWLVSLALCSEAIIRPVSHLRASVIAAPKLAGSAAWTFIAYSGRNPWIKNWIITAAGKLLRGSTRPFSCLKRLT